MFMKKKTWFLSKDGKTRIHTLYYIPAGETKGQVPVPVDPKGIVQICHGMIEHMGRYDEFARFLVSQGYIVAGHDHLGHGDSVRSEEERGYFCKNPSQTLVKDMHQLRRIMQKKYPGLPYFILGHSMGSFLLRQYLTVYGEGLSGAIMMGTGYVMPLKTEMGLQLIKFLALFKGWHHRSTLVRNMTYGKSYNGFDIDGSNPEMSWVTQNTEYFVAASADPKCNFYFTLNGYLGLLEAVSYSCRKSNIQMIPKDVPLLIISGDQDPVGDLGRAVVRFKRLCREADISDLTMKLYRGDRHDILHEPDREQVYQDILEWIENRGKTENR